MYGNKKCRDKSTSASESAFLGISAAKTMLHVWPGRSTRVASHCKPFLLTRGMDTHCFRSITELSREQLLNDRPCLITVYPSSRAEGDSVCEESATISELGISCIDFLSNWCHLQCSTDT